MSLIKELVDTAVAVEPLSESEKQYFLSLQDKCNDMNSFIKSLSKLEKLSLKQLDLRLKSIKNQLCSLFLREKCSFILDENKALSLNLIPFRFTSYAVKSDNGGLSYLIDDSLFRESHLMLSADNSGPKLRWVDFDSEKSRAYYAKMFELKNSKQNFILKFNKILPSHTRKLVNEYLKYMYAQNTYIICEILDLELNILSDEMVLAYYHDNKFWLIDTFKAISPNEIEAKYC